MAKILVVDDDMINRKLLNVLLKKSGYDVIEAENGMEALNIIKQEPVDMVLLDIIMPIMDGIDLLKILKNDSNYSNLPVAILTTDDTRRNEALNIGACDVLIKPIKEPDLKALLAKSL